MEYGVLLLLAQNEERAMNADVIYEKVWGQPMGTDRNALQKSISYLRKKIKPAGYTINNIYGKGQYVLERV
jgi:DNA-binding response OmpR family regulator